MPKPVIVLLLRAAMGAMVMIIGLFPPAHPRGLMLASASLTATRPTKVQNVGADSWASGRGSGPMAEACQSRHFGSSSGLYLAGKRRFSEILPRRNFCTLRVSDRSQQVVGGSQSIRGGESVRPLVEAARAVDAKSKRPPLVGKLQSSFPSYHRPHQQGDISNEC